MSGVKRQAFTLIELLVVVAIIAVLIAVLLPSLGRARDSAKRTVCATNLKGQGTAMATYSSGSNDSLPIFANALGNWLHDEPAPFGDALTTVPLNNSGSNTMRRWFYCPANEFLSDDSGWTKFTATGYRAFGYNYLNFRRNNFLPLGTNGKLQRYSKKLPDISYQKKWNPRFAGDIEVAFDMIYVSSDRGTDFSTSGPHGGLIDVATSHIRGKTPLGENVLYLDGHVQWKPWAGINRATCISNSNQSFVYVIDP
jgi:prepilin-type N-terminal cleavage/methylation domain-containing protein